LIWELNVVAQFKASDVDLPGTANFRIQQRGMLAGLPPRKIGLGRLIINDSLALG
jgi:hypothetical protein